MATITAELIGKNFIELSNNREFDLKKIEEARINDEGILFESTHRKKMEVIFRLR